jgi:hypothetical protein
MQVRREDHNILGVTKYLRHLLQWNTLRLWQYESKKHASESADDDENLWLVSPKRR